MALYYVTAVIGGNCLTFTITATITFRLTLLLSLVRSHGYKRMTNQDNPTTVCGLPTLIAFSANDSVSFVNDVLAAAVNVPLSVFAFLSNLLVIITVAKTPSLQRPANVLLCSLAATDCLTGFTTQPLFSIWRLMLYRARHSCYLQTELFELRYVLTTLTLGWSLTILTLISFDRARALSNPLVYRTEVTNKGMLVVTSMHKNEPLDFFC